MKNGNDEENGLMFTLYGGKKGGHLSDNGLSMQFYGSGYALGPDAQAYESYWSDDASYHRGVVGSNTIVPGYLRGEITINAMEPHVNATSLSNKISISGQCSFADVSAKEKRRLVAMVRTSKTTGYYIDIFRSDQDDNDYLHHNLGNQVTFMDDAGKRLDLKPVDDLGTDYNKAYSFFGNQRKASYSGDFLSTWTITKVTPNLKVNLWMMGQKNREIYSTNAPPSTLRTDLTPGSVNKSPQSTPTMILRQSHNNAKKSPFVAVIESYKDNEKSIEEIRRLKTDENFVSLKITMKSGKKQVIYNSIDEQKHKPSKGITFQGIYGLYSQNEDGFDYIYLGKGKLMEVNGYRMEAVANAVSAQLEKVENEFFYSSDGPVRIKLQNGNLLEYPAGNRLRIKSQQ